MKRLVVLVLALIGLVSVVVAGCQQAAPAPTPAPAKPAAAAAAPAKAPAVEPTKAPAPAQTQAPAPTAAPAKKVDFPQKGKSIMMIVPYTAGGTTDLQGRFMAPVMEKDLGVSVEVVNRPGGGAQIGYTELAKAKPDGYTIGWVLFPGVQTVYLDADRKAVFGRKDLQPMAMHTVDPHVVAVKADSKYKTVKDLVDEAKANPGKVRISTAALMGDGHLGLLMFQQAVGARFAIVNFDASVGAITELLGGRVDACVQSLPNFTSQLKSNDVRLLGIMDKAESKYAPGVKTLESQGWKVYAASEKLIAAPAGLPPEVFDLLKSSVKKAIQNDDVMKRVDELRAAVRYLDGKELDDHWTQVEQDVKPLIDLAKQK